jgi:hypothetical protein
MRSLNVILLLDVGFTALLVQPQNWKDSQAPRKERAGNQWGLDTSQVTGN